MNPRAFAALLALGVQASFAQSSVEKAEVSPCRAIVERFGSQKAWWETSTNWPELKPVPASTELAWQPPLHITHAVHGATYYLVAHPNAERCYVAVCQGTANLCRFFQVPKVDESPNR